MDDHDRQRLQGLVDLAHVGVDEVTSLVERHHRRATNRTFDVLEAVPGVAAPARVVRLLHDATLTVTYGAIRGVNGLVAAAGRTTGSGGSGDRSPHRHL